MKRCNYPFDRKQYSNCENGLEIIAIIIVLILLIIVL